MSVTRDFDMTLFHRSSFQSGLRRFIQRSCVLAISAFLLQAPVFAASSVWKVSKGGDELYLGGTIHLLPPSAFPLPVEFEQAYQKADVLVLEAKLPDPSDQQAAMAMLTKLSYTNGDTLSQKLGPKALQALTDYLKTFNLTPQQFNGFKPGFVAIQIAMLELQKAGMAGEGVDAFFVKKATADMKTQQYLETVEFQLDLMANMGAGNEGQFMLANLKRADETAALLTQSIAAWRVGDIAALDRILLNDVRTDDPASFELMFTKRNLDWIPKIQRLFGNGQRELILVGAGHLPGEDGVLALLRAAGYQVEPFAPANAH
jgi:uncharacterized protein YbaP (TraB family)